MDGISVDGEEEGQRVLETKEAVVGVEKSRVRRGSAQMLTRLGVVCTPHISED